MTIKAGEKITFRTMKYNTPPTSVTLTLPGKDGAKKIVLKPGQNGPEKTTPRRLNYITTYAGGSATQTGLNPDIDEIFTDSKNVTGRTRYELAVVKLFYPNRKEYPFTIADQDVRTKMKVNGTELNGFTFTTEGKTGFIMPSNLVKDSVIGITNTDVRKAAVSSEKVEEKVQAKVTFDLNGGKLPTTTKSFEGFDTTKLPGTEFAYKLKRAKETDPVVRIAPMNEKAASDTDYTPNGFKVEKYIDHNGDALTGDALELRKIVENPTKDGVEFYGWTTKKVTSVEDYNKLEELKTAEQAKDTTKAYKFTENSPILTGTTVYAFYGPSKSEVAKASQTYDEATDKQYIEIAPEAGDTLAENATYKLVTKNEDGTYTPVDGLTATTKEDGTPVFDITNLSSDKFDPNGKYYIETTEKGKEPSYSTKPIKIDKVAPSFDEEALTVEQDAYGYQVKISANASDDSGILRLYESNNKDSGYYDKDASLTSADLKEGIYQQSGKDKTYYVIAIDKFGNKVTAKKSVEKKAEPLQLNADVPYEGDDYIYVSSEEGADVKIEVLNSDESKAFEINTNLASGYAEIDTLDDGSTFEFEQGQTVIITASKDGQTAKLTLEVD